MPRGKRIPYEENHKINEEGELEKNCNICNEWLPCTEDYFHKSPSNKTDGLYPYCKKCASKKAIKQWKDDPIKHEENRKRHHQTKKFKKWMRKNQEDMKDYRVQYRKENKDKIHMYNKKRSEHKKHNIPKKQLEVLYNYANNSCMYCGLTEKESKLKFKEKLHKDHAINEGNNTIDNCILACKSCNSEKHKTDWNIWYNPENPKYTEERYNNIKQWLEVECKKLNLKKII